MRATAACGITRPEWLRLSRQPRNHLIAIQSGNRCVETAHPFSCDRKVLPVASNGFGLFLYAPLRTRKGASGRKFADEARNQEIIRQFFAGSTSPEIGERFGLGPTSVSRLLRSYGIKRSQGGKEVAGRERRAKLQAEKWEKKLLALGCEPADFSSREDFASAYRKFGHQKKRAAQRGIGWSMTFGEWWHIWQESGLWLKRGRSASDSAVMARRGDVGPYSASNVYIITLADNFKESWVTSPGRMAHRKGAQITKGLSVHASSVFCSSKKETVRDRNTP